MRFVISWIVALLLAATVAEANHLEPLYPTIQSRTVGRREDIATGTVVVSSTTQTAASISTLSYSTLILEPVWVTVPAQTETIHTPGYTVSAQTKAPYTTAYPMRRPGIRRYTAGDVVAVQPSVGHTPINTTTQQLASATANPSTPQLHYGSPIGLQIHKAIQASGGSIEKNGTNVSQRRDVAAVHRPTDRTISIRSRGEQVVQLQPTGGVIHMKINPFATVEDFIKAEHLNVTLLPVYPGMPRIDYGPPMVNWRYNVEMAHLRNKQLKRDIRQRADEKLKTLAMVRQKMFEADVKAGVNPAVLERERGGMERYHREAVEGEVQRALLRASTYLIFDEGVLCESTEDRCSG